ncbi:MAG: type VI secretion system protein TssA [Planctomycetes bacterium]|nr:type VI secretion system protein TssA [Planctomycetota bacterium]
MASPVELDLDLLLRPIAEAQPCGPDLREDASPSSPFLEIKDARRNARAAERTLSSFSFGAEVAAEGDDARAATEARATADQSWERILELAPAVIAERSKDLEVTAYWIEALTRQRGFAGLRDGLKLARGLVEAFWDTLYPAPDAEDGVAARSAPLANLNGDGPDGPLPSRIALLPLTDAIDERGGFSTWHFNQARELGRLTNPDERGERERAGAVSMAHFEAAIAATDAASLAQTAADIEEALAEWEALSRAIGERSQGYFPPASAVRDALASALDTLRFSAKDKLESESAFAASADAAGPGPQGDAASERGARPQVPGVIQSREDAFRALQSAAQYFRRTEPHSPLSYAIEQAVRWGSLSLPELLRELVTDESARAQYFQRVGIKDDSLPS